MLKSSKTTPNVEGLASKFVYRDWRCLLKTTLQLWLSCKKGWRWRLYVLWWSNKASSATRVHEFVSSSIRSSCDYLCDHLLEGAAAERILLEYQFILVKALRSLQHAPHVHRWYFGISKWNHQDDPKCRGTGSAFVDRIAGACFRSEETP